MSDPLSSVHDPSPLSTNSSLLAQAREQLASSASMLPSWSTLSDQSKPYPFPTEYDISPLDRLAFNIISDWSGATKAAADFTVADFTSLKQLILAEKTIQKLKSIGKIPEDLLIQVLAFQHTSGGEPGALQALSYREEFANILRYDFSDNWFALAVLRSEFAENQSQALIRLFNNPAEVYKEFSANAAQNTEAVRHLAPLADRVSNYEELVTAVLDEWLGFDRDELRNQDIAYLIQILARKEIQEARIQYSSSEPNGLLVSVLARLQPDTLLSLLDSPGKIMALVNAGYLNPEQWVRQAIEANVLAKSNPVARAELDEKFKTVFFTTPIELYSVTYQTLVTGVLMGWSGFDKTQLTHQDIADLVRIIDTLTVKIALEGHNKTPEDLLVSVLSESKLGLLNYLLSNPSEVEFLVRAGYRNARQLLATAIKRQVNADNAVRERMREKLAALTLENGVTALRKPIPMSKISAITGDESLSAEGESRHKTVTEKEVLEYLEKFARGRESMPPTELLLEPILVTDPSQLDVLASLTLQHSDGSEEAAAIVTYNGKKYLGFVNDDTSLELIAEIKTKGVNKDFALIYALYGLTITFKDEQAKKLSVGRTDEQINGILFVQLIKDGFGMASAFGDMAFLENQPLFIEWLVRSIAGFVTGPVAALGFNALLTKVPIPFLDKVPEESLTGYMGYIGLLSYLIFEDARDERGFGLRPAERTPLSGRLTSWEEFGMEYKVRFFSLVIAGFLGRMIYQSGLQDPEILFDIREWGPALTSVRNNPKLMKKTLTVAAGGTTRFFLQVLIATIIADSPLAPDDKDKVTAHFMAMMSNYTSTIYNFFYKALFADIKQRLEIKWQLNAALEAGNTSRHSELQQKLDALDSQPLIAAQEMEEIIKLIQQLMESAGYVLNGDATSLIGNALQMSMNILKGVGDIFAELYSSHDALAELINVEADHTGYHLAASQAAFQQAGTAATRIVEASLGITRPQNFAELMPVTERIDSNITRTVYRELMLGPLELIIESIDKIGQLHIRLEDKSRIDNVFLSIVLAARDKGQLHLVIEKLNAFELAARNGNKQAERIAADLRNVLRLAVWYHVDRRYTPTYEYNLLSVKSMDRRLSDLDKLTLDLLIHWTGTRKSAADFTAEDFKALKKLISSSDTEARLANLNLNREKEITKKYLLVSVLARQRSPNGQAGAIRALIANPDYERIFIDRFTGPWLASAVEYSQVSKSERNRITKMYHEQAAGRHNNLIDNYNLLISMLLGQWSGYDKSMSELSRQDMMNLKDLIYQEKGKLAALAAADDGKKDGDEKKDYSTKGALVSMLARAPVTAIEFLLHHPEEIRFLEIAGFGDPLGIKQPPGWLASVITHHTRATQAQKQRLEAMLNGLKQDYFVDRQTRANEIIDNAFDGISTDPISSAGDKGGAHSGRYFDDLIPVIPTVSPEEPIENLLNPNLDDVFKKPDIPGTTPGRRL